MQQLPSNEPKAEEGLTERWQKLETPMKIGVLAGIAVVVLLAARYLLPFILGAIGIAGLLLILFVPYWLPTIIAFMRNHPNKLPIALVNFAVGWTFIGWWISLFWAIVSPNQQQQVVVNTVVNATGNQVSHPGYPQPGMQQGFAQPGYPQPGYAPQAMPQPMQQPAVPQPGYAPQAGPAPLAAPQYQVGDVVSGHRFNGSEWVPLTQAPPEVSPAPAPPPADQPPPLGA